MPRVEASFGATASSEPSSSMNSVPPVATPRSSSSSRYTASGSSSSPTDGDRRPVALPNAADSSPSTASFAGGLRLSRPCRPGRGDACRRRSTSSTGRRRRRPPRSARIAPRLAATARTREHRRRPRLPCATSIRASVGRSDRSESEQTDLAAQLVARCPRRTRSRTSSINAWTSSAEPPSSAWMKLACLSDTCAEPTRSAAQAELVDQRPGAHLARHRVDEHRPGVLTAGLVGPTPCHDLADGRFGVGRSPRAPVAAPRRCTSAPAPRSLPRNRRPRSRGADAPRHGQGRGPIEVGDGDLDQRGRDVRSVSAGVHPHRPADRTRHADRPLEPGQPARRHLAGEHGQRAPTPRRARRRCSASISNPIGERRRRHDDPREAGVGDEHVRPAPEHRPPAARTPATALADTLQVVERADPDEHCRRATDPIGGQRADRHVELRRVRRARQRRTSRRRRSRAVDRRARSSAGTPGIEHLRRKRRDVAATHRDAHVAGPRLGRHETHEVVPARQPHQPLLRMGLGHGVHEQLAGDPRDRRRSPRRRCR